MPKYYRFKRNPGGNRAVTDDRTGGKLPVRPGQSWQYEKEVEINIGDATIGADPEKVIELVSQSGYYVYPTGK